MRKNSRDVCRMEAVERRILFAYDLAVTDIAAPEGTFSPGQQISVDFTFANNGDTPSPATSFFLFLQTSLDDDESGYGGTLFDDFTSEGFVGFPIPSLAAGETRVITINRPVGTFVFNGGPYELVVFAGFGDQDLFANDTDPTNNFFTSAPLISIVNGFAGLQDTPSNPEPVVGELDPTFGDDNSGVRTNILPVANLQTLATTFDAATSTQYAIATRGTDLFLLRFGNDGSLDSTFATAGVLPLSQGGAAFTTATLQRAGDGSLFITAAQSAGNDFLVAKLNSVGALDNSFGTNGVLTAPVLVNDLQVRALALAIAADGTPTVVGSIGAVGSRDIAIVRLSQSGQVTGSPTVVDLGGDDVASVALFNTDNSLIVAGSSGSRAVAIRFAPDGSRDLRFGTRGVATVTVNPGREERFVAASLGLRGAVYLTGYSAAPDGSASSVFVSRLARTGRADSGFGRRGLAAVDLGSALAVPNTLLTTPDGGVLLSAQVATSLGEAAQQRVGAAFARLDIKGKLVTNFGTNGVSRVLIPGTAPASVADIPGSFSDFVASRDGVATLVPGGKVRALASDPISDATIVRVAQLNADGVDLAPSFPKPLTAKVRAGGKGSVSVKLSNLGTLPASGSLSMSVALVPVNAGPGQTGGNIGSTSARVKLNPGASRNQSVRVSYPRSAVGLYSLIAQVNPTSGITDLSSDNNSASIPNQLTFGGGAPLRLSGWMLPPMLVRLAPDRTSEPRPLPIPPLSRAPFVVAPASPVERFDLFRADRDDLFSSQPVA